MRVQFKKMLKKFRDSLGSVKTVDAILALVGIVVVILALDEKLIEIRVYNKYKDVIAITDSLRTGINLLDEEYNNYKDSITRKTENMDSTYKHSEDSIISRKNEVDSLLIIAEDSVNYYKQISGSILDLNNKLANAKTKYNLLFKQKEILDKKLKIITHRNDSLMAISYHKDESYDKLRKKLFSMSDGMEAYAEGVKYESFGDSEKGFFKSTRKRIEFYLLAKEKYKYAFDIGVVEADKRFKHVDSLLDILDSDDKPHKTIKKQ